MISTNVTSINGEFIPEGDSYTGIYFELWSDNSSDLAEGTYSYSNSEDGFTYTYSEIHKDISTDTFTGEYIDITSGELEVNDQIIKLIYFGDNEITIFFNKKDLNLKGWEIKDQYNNNINFSLNIIAKNDVFKKGTFKVPEIN